MGSLWYFFVNIILQQSGKNKTKKHKYHILKKKETWSYFSTQVWHRSQQRHPEATLGTVLNYNVHITGLFSNNTVTKTAEYVLTTPKFRHVRVISCIFRSNHFPFHLWPQPQTIVEERRTVVFSLELCVNAALEVNFASQMLTVAAAPQDAITSVSFVGNLLLPIYFYLWLNSL